MTIRVIGALAALVSAVVHLYLWFDGVKDQGTVGALFVVNVIAGVVIAALLVKWRSWEPFFLLLGFGIATLGAFLIAETVGLFGIKTDWSWYAWLAAVSEIVAILGAVAGSVREGYLPRGARQSGSRA